MRGRRTSTRPMRTSIRDGRVAGSAGATGRAASRVRSAARGAGSLAVTRATVRTCSGGWGDSAARRGTRVDSSSRPGCGAPCTGDPALADTPCRCGFGALGSSGAATGGSAPCSRAAGEARRGLADIAARFVRACSVGGASRAALSAWVARVAVPASARACATLSSAGVASADGRLGSRSAAPGTNTGSRRGRSSGAGTSPRARAASPSMKRLTPAPSPCRRRL
jgi:hypothetical protein